MPKMSMKNDDFVSVIICTYNRTSSLRNVLITLQNQNTNSICKYEIIIVDNNSTDSTKEVVDSFISIFEGKLRYIFEPQQGKSHAMNRGIREAKGNILVFTDDDVLIESEWLSSIYKCFKDYDCDGVGGRVLPLYDKNIPSWVKKNKDIFAGPMVNYDFGEDIKIYANGNFFPFIGANMAYRKSCFEKYGFFNINFGVGTSFLGEDTEYFQRMEKYDLKLYYYGKALVWHPIDISRTKLPYLRKWYFKFGRYQALEEYNRLAAQRYKFFLGLPKHLYKDFIGNLFFLFFKFYNKNRFMRAWAGLFFITGQCYQFWLMNSGRWNAALITSSARNKKYEGIENVVFMLRSCGELAGTERTVLNWCKFIDFEKINVTLCSIKGKFWGIFNKKVPNVNLIYYSLDSVKNDYKKFKESKAFFEKIKATKIIWCLNTTYDFSFSEILASWMVTKGNIYISHHNYLNEIEYVKPRLWFGMIPGLGLWRIRAKIEFYLEHILCRKILVVSKETKDCLKKWNIPDRKMTERMTCIDLMEFYPDNTKEKYLRNKFNISENANIFIAANRFNPEKRIDRLLGAFLLLLKNHSKENYLIILGDGSSRGDYQNRVARNLLLKTHVIFLGTKDDINNFLQGAQYLLLASDFEGLGRIILEAMACNVIPIITDSFGPRQLADNVFMSKRNVYDFYHMIQHVLSQPKDILDKMRKTNIEKIKLNHDLQVVSNFNLSFFGLPSKG